MTALSAGTRRGRPTLADVAKAAGVSPITASRALRGAGLVASVTRERVAEAAARLGYTPNLLARALVHNRTTTIGVVVVEVANPFFAPMISAVEGEAAKRGFLVIIGESARDERGERQYVERFQQLLTAGIIVTPATKRLDHLAAARDAGVPVVVMSRRWEGGDFVTVDNTAGGRLAAQHLLSRGHRRIGMITHAGPMDTSFEDRIRGFRRALTGAGIAAARWELHTQTTLMRDGEEAADAFLAWSQRPTAIFAMTDRIAMGLVRRLLQRGVRVPDDVAVVGYDDIPFAEYTHVPLTTIRVPVSRVGEIAAEILFDRLEGRPRHARHVLLRPELVIRDSSP